MAALVPVKVQLWTWATFFLRRISRRVGVGVHVDFALHYISSILGPCLKIKKSGVARFKPRVSGWATWTLPLCYATPPPQPVLAYPLNLFGNSWFWKDQKQFRNHKTFSYPPYNGTHIALLYILWVLSIPLKGPFSILCTQLQAVSKEEPKPAVLWEVSWYLDLMSVIEEEVGESIILYGPSAETFWFYFTFSWLIFTQLKT